MDQEPMFSGDERPTTLRDDPIEDLPGTILAGAPALEEPALAIEFRHGSRAGDRVVIGDGQHVRIGRRDSCDVPLDARRDTCVSSEHALIGRDDGGSFFIEDLKSSNGTRLNGEALVGREPLGPGDLVELGRRAGASLDGCVVFIVEISCGAAAGEATLRSERAVPGTILAEARPAALSPPASTPRSRGLWGQLKGRLEDIREKRDILERLRELKHIDDGLARREEELMRELGAAFLDRLPPTRLPEGELRRRLEDLEAREATLLEEEAEARERRQDLDASLADGIAAIEAELAPARGVAAEAATALDRCVESEKAATRELAASLDPARAAMREAHGAIESASETAVADGAHLPVIEDLSATLERAAARLREDQGECKRLHEALEKSRRARLVAAEMHVAAHSETERLEASTAALREEHGRKLAVLERDAALRDRERTSFERSRAEHHAAVGRCLVESDSADGARFAPWDAAVATHAAREISERESSSLELRIRRLEE